MAKLNETDLQYERQVRGPDGTIYLEKFYWMTINGGNSAKHKITLTRPDHGLIGVSEWKHDAASNECDDLSDTMPDWWRAPENMQELSERYKAGGGETLPTTNNVVTFATYMADGRLQLQQRSYVSPAGETVVDAGLLSINGGLMEDGESAEYELCRKVWEELGITLLECDFEPVGAIYDAENGRCNHVYRIDGYDTILRREYSDVAKVVEILTNPEGLGRSYMWREDWDAACASGDVTDISMAIMKAFPELLPPPRPS